MNNDFDYIDFAKNLYKQALEIDPIADYKDIDKQFIANYLQRYSLMAGKALNEDSSLEINTDDKIFITQVVAEWTYHKLFDLLKLDISKEYWEPILQEIAFTVFEIAKQGISRNISQDQVVQAVEHHVNKVYNSSLELLLEKDIITKEQYKNATTQTYIDKLCTEKQIEENKTMEKSLKKNFLNIFILVTFYQILKYTNFAKPFPKDFYIIEKLTICTIIILLVVIIVILSKMFFKYIQKILSKK